jgi:AraC-like DNA-binding protein/quercetin dioxygenase-like cupin family protein
VSRSRQAQPLSIEEEQFLTVRSVAVTCSSGYVIATHKHDWHQLVYACAGAMTVSGGRWSWMIPPGKAVFIPAGCRHSIRMWGKVTVRSLYFPASLKGAALAFEDCRVLSVTPLLRELILRVIECGALDLRVPRHQSLLNVLLDEMNIAPVAPLMLPLPEDARALAVARHMLACPTAAETLDDLSRRYGVGRRTLERLFSRQTGLSFGLWRQKARLLDSIRLLAEGKSVTEAAFDTGYSSVSAFIAAFRHTFGCTPAKY